MSDVTQILSKIESGDQPASEELLPLIYEELRKLAAARWPASRRTIRFNPRPWCMKRTCVWLTLREPSSGIAEGIFFLLLPKQCGEFLLSPLVAKTRRSGAATAGTSKLIRRSSKRTPVGRNKSLS